MPVEHPYTWYDLGQLAWIDTGTTTTGRYDWVVNTTGWENTPYTVTFNTANTSSATLNLWTGGSGWRTTPWVDSSGRVHEERPVRNDQAALHQAVANIEAVAEDEARRVAHSEARSSARAQAIARGEELLLSLLDEAQIASYRLDGHFEVIGSHGTLYRVHRGTSGNIEWVKPDGSVGGRLCAHPTMAHDWLPTEDVMLAQLLALQHNEREFVRVANVHAGTRPPMREVARARWEQSVVVG